MPAASKLDLTDAVIRSLEAPEKGETIVWDKRLPGLALRVAPKSRTWTLVYRPRGAGRAANPRKLKLGTWPALKPEAARKAAQIEIGRIAAGEDPAAAQREAKRKADARFSTVLDDYEAALEKRRYVNASTVMSTLRRGLASLAARDVASLTRVEIVRQIERLEKAGKPGAAADLRKHTRTLLEWTTSGGLTPFNPLAGLRRQKETKAQRLETAERGKALTDDELLRLWNAADPEAVLGRYIRALILTGARRAEMARLEWSMVRDDRLVIPPSHTKQGREHEIPVTPELRAVLEQCTKTPGGLVFASPISGGAMSGWTQHVKRLVKASGVAFTLHDLRRTFRSGLTRLGVEHDVAELMLAHQRDDLVRRYDKEGRWPDRVAAAKLWSEHVAGLIAKAEQGEPSNVVRLAMRKSRALRAGAA